MWPSWNVSETLRRILEVKSEEEEEAMSDGVRGRVEKIGIRKFNVT